jgi:hypothetical protein
MLHHPRALPHRNHGHTQRAFLDQRLASPARTGTPRFLQQYILLSTQIELQDLSAKLVRSQV